VPCSPPASTYIPVASKPRCRCMKLGHAGVSAALRPQATSVPSPSGRSFRVSQTDALLITALRALMEAPPRSTTPLARPLLSSCSCCTCEDSSSRPPNFSRPLGSHNGRRAHNVRKLSRKVLVYHSKQQPRAQPATSHSPICVLVAVCAVFGSRCQCKKTITISALPFCHVCNCDCCTSCCPYP
jgi:hypothetical protein